MPFYKGKVKCIYIDPPYNTGNESWVYNDKVNSPKIKEWLGKVVGKESEDLTRHDKWLCMMYPRLKLLRDLLSDDGVIFISIGDHEQHRLHFIMDELFGEKNFVADFIWNHRKSSQNDIDVSLSHNYTLCYALKRDEFSLNSLGIDDSKFSNPDNDPRGDWVADPMDAPAIRENLMYPITNPNTKETFLPPKGRHWRFTKEKFQRALRDNRILFGKTGRSKPQFKRFKSEAEEKGTNASTIWNDVGTATEGTQELMDLFGGKKVFNTPKPTSLVKKILKLATKRNSIILDSFAGSGTTAHAVMDINSDDEGIREFIMVEMEDSVAKKITTERVKRAIKKYRYKDSFDYCELAQPLFNSSGQINEACTYNELATYVYFTETHTNINPKAIKNPCVSAHAGISYYLIFKGMHKNDLTRGVLTKLKVKGPAVIYADRCLVDEDELRAKGITFKQIPYEIKVY